MNLAGLPDAELGPMPITCSGCGNDATPEAHYAFECLCEHGSCTECGVPYRNEGERKRRECAQCLAEYEDSGTGNIAGAQSAQLDPVSSLLGRAADRDSGLASGGAAFDNCDAFCRGCIRCLADF